METELDGREKALDWAIMVAGAYTPPLLTST
jgi:hypothetical protein